MRSTILLAAILTLAGCGGGTTDVVGTVKFQGKALVFGTVMLLGSDGIPRYGTIQTDGSFKVEGVKTGSVKAAVTSFRPPGAPKTAAAKKIGRDEGMPDERTTFKGTINPDAVSGWFPIPEKYGDPTTSELAFDIIAGQPLEIVLK